MATRRSLACMTEEEVLAQLRVDLGDGEYFDAVRWHLRHEGHLELEEAIRCDKYAGLLNYVRRFKKTLARAAPHHAAQGTHARGRARSRPVARTRTVRQERRLGTEARGAAYAAAGKDELALSRLSRLVELTPEEEERTRRLSALVAAEAAASREVRDFRRRMLDDALLTRQQAIAFMQSPAAGLRPLDWFHQRQVPTTRHTAQLLDARYDERDGRIFLSARVWARPPGVAEIVESAALEDRAARRGERGELPPEGAGEIVQYADVDDLPPSCWAVMQWLDLLRAGAGLQGLEPYLPPVPVLPGSVHAELCTVAEWLSSTYSWETLEAAMFVLTGATPRVEPFRVEVHSAEPGLELRSLPDGAPPYRRCRLVFSVAPYLSDETIAKAIRRCKRALGLRSRPRAAHKLALVDFVLEHTGADGRRPQWRELLGLWNEVYPDWKYPPGRRGYVRMQRHYSETSAAVRAETAYMRRADLGLGQLRRQHWDDFVPGLVPTIYTSIDEPFAR